MPLPAKILTFNRDRMSTLFVGGLLFCAFLLLGLDLITSITRFKYLVPAPYNDFFDMTMEGNLLSWFSSMQLFVAGLFCLLLCLLSRRERVWTAIGWGCIGLIFIFMSADDVATIHERAGITMKMIYTGDLQVHGAIIDLVLRFPSYYWQALFMPLYALLACLLLLMAIKVMSSQRALLLIASGLACYVTAVGLDFIEGLGGDGMDVVRLYIPVLAEHSLHLIRVVEEFLEIVGTTLIAGALLRELLIQADGLCLCDISNSHQGGRA